VLGAGQDHEEEDGGEDPQGDGHKHHKAVRWQQRVGGAGDQRPVEQPQKLERGERENKPDRIRRERERELKCDSDLDLLT